MHAVRLVVEGCGSLLRVRTLEAAQSMQRACYTDVSRLCMVGSVLDLKRPHSMLSEPQRRHRAVEDSREMYYTAICRLGCRLVVLYGYWQ